jgi:hypothetical protein
MEKPFHKKYTSSGKQQGNSIHHRGHRDHREQQLYSFFACGLALISTPPAIETFRAPLRVAAKRILDASLIAVCFSLFPLLGRFFAV